MGMSQAERRRGRTGPLAAGGHAIHVDIDSVVLYGIASAEAGRLAQALEAEIAALALRPAAGLQPGEIDRLPSARIATGRTPEHTGRAAAGAIWSGVISTRQGNLR
jgi:hypothetical protein